MSMFRLFAALWVVWGSCALSPALALTPLRSPEQRQRDAVLQAEASQSIKRDLTRCFNVQPTRAPQKITMRFFLSEGGKRVSQLQVVKPARIPPKRLRRAAIRAIERCAPYEVPGELRNWGGFWVTINFEG
jgi:hypothetical protein